MILRILIMGSLFMRAYKLKPVVCAVGNSYQIMVPVGFEALVKVSVNGKEYFNHSNGIRRSDTRIHKIVVPASELNAAGKYTVICEKVIKRGDYSCSKEAPVSCEFSFRPIKKTTGINIYHLSDCHGIHKPAVAAASFFGKDLDLLILNGDIASHSCRIADVMLSYKIAYDVTKGSIPVIISRGNHDLRGKVAEKLESLLPSDRGLSYYNARVGNVWMSLVDTGEDKEDDHREYGGTAAYHAFRQDESEFLKATVAASKSEYAAKGVKYKFIISHVPFTKRNFEESKGECPFDIENDIYNEWADVIKTKIQPDFMLCGHYHRTEIFHPGDKNDDRNIPFDVIIGGYPVKPNGMVGAAITLGEGSASVKFTNEKKEILGEETVVFPVYDK